MINVAVGTVPEGPIVIRLVQDADRDAGQTGSTLIIKWVKNDETSYTTLTSGTHYTATEMTDGLYAITFTDDANGQGLFDTVGGAVMQVTATSADEYYERFYVFTPANVDAVPATLSATVMAQVADPVLRRRITNVRSSSDGDSWTTGDEQYTVVGAIEATAGKNIAASGTLTTYREDETTTAFSRSLTTVTAGSTDDITGVG